MAALARMVERQARALAVQDELLRGLAVDVKALVAKAPAKTPPPASWLLTSHPDALAELLADLVVWLRDVYLWYPGAVLPSCWMWHPACIEELAWLRQYHAEAYHPSGKSVAKAAEFHERFLPGVLHRLAAGPYADCDLTRHVPGEDRARTEPDNAPLHDDTHQIATAWMDQTIPEPTTRDLDEAHEAEAINTRRRKTK